MAQPDYEAMRQAVVDGDVDAARELASAVAVSEGDPLAAVERGFTPGIQTVGDLWEEGEYFLPELVQGAEAMKAAMEVLQPALQRCRAPGTTRGRVVIGTVRGDVHDIGKTLVGTLLAANGFEVHDLGADVAVETFLDKAREVDADLIAASALLTTTMQAQREIVSAVAGDPALAGRVRVLVGGAPTTPAWAAQIGATHAENAMGAVRLAAELVS
ncbi:MAG: cobalamin-dependent protein [Acidobacteriota bacterium]